MYHHFMGRNLIIGDIHSRYEKLMSVLSLASYDPKVDTLYALGDFTDRGRDAYMTLSFLMEQKNLKAVIGNHDLYLQNWLYTASPDEHWKRYLGGNKTVKDIKYRRKVSNAECIMIADWLRSLPLVLLEDKYIITHGGIPKGMDINDLVRISGKKRDAISLMKGDERITWDRDYFLSAFEGVYRDELFSHLEPFDTEKTIFVGHTPIPSGKTLFSEGYHLIALDTGAGKGGMLTLMDMDSKEYWQA